MTNSQRGTPDDDTKETILRRYLDALTVDLTAHLDLAAGLREVLLTSRQDAVLRTVTAELDTDAGLAAIIDSAATPDLDVADRWRAAPALPPTPPVPLSNPVAELVTEMVAALSPAQRLALRAHPILDGADGFRRTVAVIDARAVADRVHNLCTWLRTMRKYDQIQQDALSNNLRSAATGAGTLREDLNHITLDRIALIAPGAARDYARRLLDHLNRARDRARHLVDSPADARGIHDDLESARHCTTRLVALLESAVQVHAGSCRLPAQPSDSDYTALSEHTVTFEYGIDVRRYRLAAGGPADLLADQVIRALGRVPNTNREVLLAALLSALSDLVGVDLGDADLTGLPLDGIRWSHATVWPRGWADRIARDSVPAADEPGVFIIHGGTAPVDAPASTCG